MSGDDEYFDARSEAWLRSVEHDAFGIVCAIMEEIDELTVAMRATESALTEGRRRLRDRLQKEEEEFVRSLTARLEGLGFGPFESRDQLASFMRETSETELFQSAGPEGEMSPREEAYWEWQHFEHAQHREHGVELSDRPTLFTRYGTTVALHALLESALQEFCQLARQRRRSRLAVEDLAKGSADGFKERRYLEKVHGVEVPGELWTALTPLVFVRNRIAHSSGRVHGVRSSRDFALLTQTPGLSIQGQVRERERFVNGLLRVETEFIESSVRAVYDLLKALEAKMAEWDQLRAVR